jgi:hypothetical protein
MFCEGKSKWLLDAVIINISYKHFCLYNFNGKQKNQYLFNSVNNKHVFNTQSPIVRGCIHNFRYWCCHLYSSCSSMMQW